MHAPVPLFAAPPTAGRRFTADPRRRCRCRRLLPHDWNALAGGPAARCRTRFLGAASHAVALRPQTGWTPRFLTAWRDGALIGAMPLYAKTHSYGEYVFDWGWADAYRRYGRRYYPKLVAAIPFTPVPGPRLSRRRSDDAPRAARRARSANCSTACTRRCTCCSPTRTQAREGAAAGMLIARRRCSSTGATAAIATSPISSPRSITTSARRSSRSGGGSLEAGVTFVRKRGAEITRAGPGVLLSSATSARIARIIRRPT